MLNHADSRRLNEHVAERLESLRHADAAVRGKLSAELNGIVEVLKRWPSRLEFCTFSPSILAAD
jgi:hypothetical protein